MRKTKSFILIFLTSILLVNCSSVKETFGTNKNRTDEFLVEKKKPLTMPPDFEKLPIPNTTSDIQLDKNEKTSGLEELLKSSSDVAQSDYKINSTNSLENLILKEIKK